MNVRKLILNFFEENGVYIGEVAENDDIDLHEYIADSMQYVYFIVELEKKLGLELPDEVLLYDNLTSLNGFSNFIEKILNDGAFVSEVNNNE